MTRISQDLAPFSKAPDYFWMSTIESGFNGVNAYWMASAMSR